MITPTVWNQVITILARIREERISANQDLHKIYQNLASIEKYADEAITLLMKGDSLESLPNSQSSEVKHENLDAGQF